MSWNSCIIYITILIITKEIAVLSMKTTIGVIDGDFSDNQLQTVRIQDQNNLKRETVLQWRYTQNMEPYQVLRQAEEFTKADFDVILVNNTKHDIWRIFADLGTSYFHVHSIENKNISVVGNELCQNADDGKSSISVDRDEHSSSTYTRNLMMDVMKLMLNMRWSSVVIMHNKETVSIAEHLKKIINEKGMFAMTFSEELFFHNDYGNESTNSTLDFIYDTFNERGINITVICRLDCVQRILHQANLFDHLHKNRHQTALRQRSRWLVLTKAVNLDRDIAEYSYDLDNIAVINLKPTCSQEDAKVTSFLDTNGLIKKSTSHEMFIGGVNLTLSSAAFDAAHSDLYTRNRNTPLCRQCPVDTLLWKKKGAKIRTLDDSRGKRNFSTIGYFNVTGDFHFTGDIFPNINYGFNARSFVVTTNWWPPFMDKRNVNGTNVYFGFCQDLLDEMSRELNFTYTMTEPLDLEWGYALKNGSWTGMIGQLQNEEVDLMMAPASIQAGREMVMDFTHPYYFDTSTILMQVPNENRTKWKTYILPFKDEVHICIWIVLPLAAFLLYIFEKCNPYYKGTDEDDHRTYQNAFWYMFGAMLTQGGDRIPESQSGRTLISFWWLYSIMMVATYSGNLIAFLTVAKEKLPFNSLEELVEQDQYQWGTLSGTYFITMFKDSKLPVYQKVWDGIVKANESDPRAMSPDPAVHIQKILKEDYVYFGDKVVMDMRRVNDCRLTTADEEIPNMSYGVGLPNHSPYTKLFSNKILALLESGIFHIYEQRHWPKVNFCKGSLTTEAKAITLIDVHSAFYLIGIGITLSLMTLFVEVVCSYWRCITSRCIKHKKSNNQQDNPT